MTTMAEQTEITDGQLDLTPVFTQWYSDVEDGMGYRAHEQIIEVFDEFLVITESLDSTDYWLQPYVQSYISGRIVWGPRFRVGLEYLYNGTEMVDHLVKFLSDASRPISGKACIITDLESGETICNITDGYVDPDTVNDLIAKIQVGWDDDRTEEE